MQEKLHSILYDLTLIGQFKNLKNLKEMCLVCTSVICINKQKKCGRKSPQQQYWKIKYVKCIKSTKAASEECADRSEKVGWGQPYFIKPYFRTDVYVRSHRSLSLKIQTTFVSLNVYKLEPLKVTRKPVAQGHLKTKK